MTNMSGREPGRASEIKLMTCEPHCSQVSQATVRQLKNHKHSSITAISYNYNPELYSQLGSCNALTFCPLVKRHFLSTARYPKFLCY